MRQQAPRLVPRTGLKAKAAARAPGRSKPRNHNFAFVVVSLKMRDFRLRYRNMSLGILWSLANPLIMMLVLTFVFKNVFRNSSVKNYPAFALIGLISYNFFGLAWSTSTTSISSNAGLVKTSADNARNHSYSLRAGSVDPFLHSDRPHADFCRRTALISDAAMVLDCTNRIR
jgi:hypothetical protein